MKNILHILPVVERGGAERIHESWISSLSNEFCPHVVLPKNGFLKDNFTKLGINVMVPPEFKISSLYKTVKYIKNYIKSESIDLVHSSMPYGHLFGGLSGIISGCKEIWSSHGPISSNFYQGIIPVIPSSYLLVHSQYMYDLQRKTLFNAKKLKLVPYGVDTDIVYPNPNNAAILKIKHNLPSNAMFLGIVGRINEWKGQHIVLKSFQKILKKHTNMYCLIIGGSIFGVGTDYYYFLKKLVVELGIGDRVIFTGHIENVYDYYDLLDIVIHASLIPEPFGLVVAEAMAKGKVCIATKNGGPSEMIEDCNNGFLYQAGDVLELTDRLLEIIENFQSDYVKSISNKAIESINNNFSLRKSIEQIEACYNSVLNE